MGWNNLDLFIKKSIELDSTFIEPYIGLAMAHLLSGLVWGIVPQDEAWANAKPLLLIAKEEGFQTFRCLR